ncbi:YitT family protein [Priestia abyssalis]|uniref:YitT family protein n=1 Tax=Priestia abyssalis TaxID=1221450 RepID=UPI0009959554|nr:YitT family protein [Priestia abyssalis]
MYSERLKYINDSRSAEMPFYKRVFYILCGALLVAISLELFLIKNHVIDGGIVGMSIVISHITRLEVGYVLLILNTPFLLLGYRYLGRNFVFLSLFAILALAMGTFILEPIPALTKNPVVVVVLGGIILGMGVGIIIRCGGSLDGTEIVAILLNKRSRFSIGQYVMFFNIFILGSAFFVFGVYETMYSLSTYLVVYNTMDLIMKNS